MSTKFKIGDKVIVHRNTGGSFWSLHHEQFVGRVVTISAFAPFGWFIQEHSRCIFLDEFLSLVDEKTKDTPAKKYANNCPCGIHHSMCDYHK